jgi:hypothetical protein
MPERTKDLGGDEKFSLLPEAEFSTQRGVLWRLAVVYVRRG